MQYDTDAFARDDIPAAHPTRPDSAAAASPPVRLRARGRRGPRVHNARMYLTQLQRKLENDPSRPNHLLTKAGMGYRIEGVATQGAPNVDLRAKVARI